MMCLWASKKRKYEKTYFLHPFIQWRKKSDPEFDQDPDPLVRGKDPGIRIRTKMSRIPNTDRRKRLFTVSWEIGKKYHAKKMTAREKEQGYTYTRTVRCLYEVKKCYYKKEVSVPDPWNFGVDADPNPRIHASD